MPLLAYPLLFGLYVLFAGHPSLPELIAAGFTAAGATAYHVRVMWFPRRWIIVTAPWVRLSGRVLRGLATDTPKVGWELLRAIAGCPSRGELIRQPFDPGGVHPRAAGRRALVVLAASIAPNAYVIEVLEPPNGLLLHRLVPTPPREDRQWPV